MKIRNLIVVLSALALPLQAAEVGISHLNLPVTVAPGKTQLVGVFLARPVLQKGKVATDLGANATSFTADAAIFNYTAATESAWTGKGTAGSELAPLTDNHFVVEFTSGPWTGLIKQVSSFPTTTSATVQGVLPLLTAGTTFVLRKDHTLVSLFGDGTANFPIQIETDIDPSGADIVGVYTSTGAWKQFFWQDNIGWRMVGDAGAGGLNRANVRVSLGTGFSFKSYSRPTLYLTGEYRGSRSRISIDTTKGTLVANPYPVATTLLSSGLGDYLVSKTTSVPNADKIYFLENGNFVTYYNNGTNFKKELDPTVIQDTKVIGVGEAFLLKPRLPMDVAFAPQYINP